MLKQQLNFKLSQKLSPQQIQLMKLIQLPTQAFEQRIAQEMEENPALEGGKDDDESYDDDLDYDAQDSEFEDDNRTDVMITNNAKNPNFFIFPTSKHHFLFFLNNNPPIARRVRV